ncbi:MAG: tRNA lysidine(34) synthetase TilS [Oscillospiraceae bacterium]|nr:tRNA lysidine(34) synthetase TilS [Oscillospiraceae bacterium]
MQTKNILTRTVYDWCAQQHIDLAGKTVLCAVSGGRDSMALLHVLLEMAQRDGFAVAAAHYNHQLRQSAARDEELVRGHCASLGLPLFSGCGDVRAYAKTHGTSIEDAARTMRYAFLQDTARECGADYIATAHHRQDNAETLLLHLLRGSGLRGLGGIAPMRGNIIRPLLAADRADIDDYIVKNNIPYAEDETNRDTVYTRNRLRLEVLPLLEEIAPGSVRRMADTAAQLRVDEDYLRQQSEASVSLLREDDGVCVCVAQVREQHPAVAARAVRRAAYACGANLTAAQTDAVLRLRRGACLALGGGVRVAHDGEFLRFFRLSDPPAPMELTPGEHDWGAWRVCVWETDEEVAENAHTVVLRGGSGKAEIAAWDGTGRLGTETGRRTVKRLLADHRIGAAQREDRPAIYLDGVLAAVFGAGTDRDFRPAAGEMKLAVSIKNKIL